jgi:hypothetical protein
MGRPSVTKTLVRSVSMTMLADVTLLPLALVSTKVCEPHRRGVRSAGATAATEAATPLSVAVARTSFAAGYTPK